MANTPIVIAGAETGNLTLEAAANSGTLSIVTSPTRSGSGARVFQCNPTGSGSGFATFAGYSATTGKNAASAISGTAFDSFYFRVDTLPASAHEIIAGFYTALVVTTPVATLHINSSGNLGVYNAAGTVVATGSTALSTTTWYKIDFSANRTTGAYQVNINGVSELSGSGAAFGSTNIGNFTIGKVADTSSQTVNFYYDDVWFDSQAFAPSGYIMLLDKATANGTTMSWTTSDAGAGTGDYTHINAIPAVTTSFVEDPAGTSLPVIAEFAMQTYAQMGINAGSTIYCIQAVAFLKDTTTVANTVQFGIISAAATSIFSTAANTSNAAVNFGRLIINDPNTTAAWTQSGLEAVQLYVQEGTTAVNTQMSGASITVALVQAAAAVSTGSNLLPLGVG